MDETQTSTEQPTQTNEPTATETLATETPKEPTVAELKAAYEASQRDLANAKRESEGAQAYLQMLLGTLQTAAQTRTSADAPQDQRTLAERLAENPDVVLDEHFRSRMGPIYQAYLDNQNLQNRELAAERLRRDDKYQDAEGQSYWDKYQREINEFMQGMPPEVKARPGAYERALKFVLADKLDEVSDDKARKMAKKREAMERGAFVEGSSGAATRTKTPDVLTSLEKEIAKGLGMKEEDFLKAKKMDQFGNSGG